MKIRLALAALLLAGVVTITTVNVNSKPEVKEVQSLAASDPVPLASEAPKISVRQAEPVPRVTTTTTTIPPTTTTTTSPPPTTTTTSPPPPPPTPAPAPVAAEPSGYSGGGNGDPNDMASWDRLAQCESGGNWAINTGNGYYGGLQFSLSSWRGVGGTGYPHEHSRATQIAMGQRLHAQGGWGHWPGCTRSFGWR